jgi:hypothetical protein
MRARTGELLSRSGHFTKARQLINGIQKLISSGSLSSSDVAKARALIQDLQDALATKPW